MLCGSLESFELTWLHVITGGLFSDSSRAGKTRVNWQQSCVSWALGAAGCAHDILGGPNCIPVLGDLPVNQNHPFLPPKYSLDIAHSFDYSHFFCCPTQNFPLSST